MDLRVEDALTILSRTPGVLARLLAGLPERWTHANEGRDSWSPFDVVGHLIHGERQDWMTRTRMVLDDDESRPFPPFDRTAMLEASRGKSLADLLETFEMLRERNLRELETLALGERELARLGRHPDFGAVTLRQLLAAWVVHDLGHLAQVARTMAKQYRDEVGPWRAYLPVLDTRARPD